MALNVEVATRAAGRFWNERWPLVLDRVLGPVPGTPRPQALGDDRRAAVVLWTSAVLLILMIFEAGFQSPGDLYSGWDSVNADGLAHDLYWAVWKYVFYFAVPLAIIFFVFKESPARYGLRWYLTPKTALVYAAMLGVMLPLLFVASSRESFQSTYPFVQDLGDNQVRSIISWEVAYVAQFLCLEFFFRGYLLFGLEGKLGYTAIAASTVPYAMIHFAKPFPEALGAIVAGAVLGLLALRTRTILGGVVIHSVVAVSMDLLALWRKDVLF
jgi:membrane protease YdiL (CAAX protease family)